MTDIIVCFSAMSLLTGEQGGARILLKSHQKLVNDLKVLLSNIKDFCNKTCRTKDNVETGVIEEWCSKVTIATTIST